MIIDENKLNELSQLDRIEFRQKFFNIYDTNYSTNLRFCSTMLILLCISTCSLIINYNITGYTDYNLFKFVVIFSFIFFISIFFSSFNLLFNIYNKIKKSNELINEYFVIKTKKHKKNK